MQTKTQNTPKTASPETAKPAPRKRVSKPQAVKPETEAAEPKPLRRAAQHLAAGYLNTYSGKSAPLTTTSKTAVPIGIAKYGARDAASLTPRMLAALTDAHRAYGDKPFPASGLDNAQAAIFINSGFLTHSGGVAGKRDGIDILADGAEPLMLRFTKTGAAIASPAVKQPAKRK